MSRLMSAKTDRLAAAKILLSAWGRAERLELQRACKGDARRASFVQVVPGMDCSTVSTDDVELVGRALKDIRVMSKDTYSVLVMVYRVGMKHKDIGVRIHASKSRVQTLRTSGEYYIAALI